MLKSNFSHSSIPIRCPISIMIAELNDDSLVAVLKSCVDKTHVMLQSDISHSSIPMKSAISVMIAELNDDCLVAILIMIA